MRLVVAVVALVTSSGATAQPVARPDPLGVRQFRSYPIPIPGLALRVGATEEGTVELFADAGPSFDPYVAREPRPFREFFRPSEVLEFSRALESMAGWLQQRTATGPRQVVLGARGGSRFEARAEVASNRRHAYLSTYHCETSASGAGVGEVELASIAAGFRRAALDAQSVPQPDRPPTDAVWYEHAVGCPAIPIYGNPAPAWPRGGAPLLPHEELVQFVVNESGNVELETVRFLRNARPDFREAVRAILPAWRFKPATRAGRSVRQLSHAAVPFQPGFVSDRAPCAPQRLGDECVPRFSFTTGVEDVSFRPQGDGTIRVARESERDWRLAQAERSVHRDAVPVASFRRFVDTVAALIASTDTNNWRERSQHAESAGLLAGHRAGSFLAEWMSSGWLVGSMTCGSTNSRFFAVAAPQFEAFLQASRAALAVAGRQPRWANAPHRAFTDDEVACAVAPVRDNHVPSLPVTDHRPLSTEVLLSFVVDTLGRVEDGSVEAITGPDATAIELAVRATRGWRFSPAVARGRFVRSRSHMRIVMRPADADAMTVAQRDPTLSPEDTLRRTIFFKPAVTPDSTRTPADPGIWRDAMVAIEPWIQRARESWPDARRRFRRGSPPGYAWLVTARLTDALGNQEHALIRVTGVAGDSIHGVIRSEVRSLIGWQRGDAWSLPENDLIDWTIVAPDGTEEGNVVGRFLETWQLLRPRRR